MDVSSVTVAEDKDTVGYGDGLAFDAVAAALGLRDGGQEQQHHDGLHALAADWAQSQATRPTGEILFLKPAFVAAACRGAYLPTDVTAAVEAAAAHVGAEPAWRALAWHCHYCLFRSPKYASYPAPAIRRWPLLRGARGVSDQDAGLFYLVVLLSGITETQLLYRARGIPEAVARASLYDIQRWLTRQVAPGHQPGDGNWRWVLPARCLDLLRIRLRGELYELGRLQFHFGQFAMGTVVYRHPSAGIVVALSEAGVRYRADGQLDGAGGVFDATGAWNARLTISEDAIVGSPIMPRGEALRRGVRLPRPDWQLVLAPGDPVLHMHMPEGEPLDFDRCGESLHAALAFFPRYFSDRPFAAFDCSSWLLDSQLERLLPPASNIARFQREVYLLPGGGNGRGMLERVFGRVPADLHDPVQAPRDTTLRRALLDHLLAGGHLRSGRCFLFPQDLQWGSQVYRRQAWPFDGAS